MNIDELYHLSRYYLESYNKPYKRKLHGDQLFGHRLMILLGQRGVGKTTLIIQFLLSSVSSDLLSKDILYIPTDHFLIANMTLYEIAEQFSVYGGKTLVFDEIHKYPNWSKELKSIYDTFPHLKIIASGSSALEIHKGSHDLTRRAIILSIPGLSFREYLELHYQIECDIFSFEQLNDHEAITEKILQQFKLKQRKVLVEFKNFLQIGFYPYFLDYNDKNLYYMTLEQNFLACIESDLTAIYPTLTGNTIRKIKQLLSYIATAVPFTPNFQKLKMLLQIGDERTLKTYLKYLEDAKMIRQILKASDKIRQIELPEKIYLDNANQLFAISADSPNTGTLRELFFLSMIPEKHAITIPDHGDFLIDKKITIEIGNHKKNDDQISKAHNGWLACDNIEKGYGKRIPLWLFGFLY